MRITRHTTLADIKSEMNDSFEEVERIEGSLIYLQGHPYPHKGIPTPERVFEANQLKRNPFKTSGFSCETEFGTEFSKLSPRLGLILDIDSGYRFRVQHLFTLSSKERLLNKPIRELMRLLKENKDRDGELPHLKFVIGFSILIALLLIFKGEFRRRMQRVNYEQLIFDEGDWYWAKRKKDYNYG